MKMGQMLRKAARKEGAVFPALRHYEDRAVSGRGEWGMSKMPGQVEHAADMRAADAWFMTSPKCVS
jgi:hypothetical protein